MSHSTTRGEELVSQGYLSREQLNMAQRRQREAPHLGLEEICLQMGFLTEESFRKVLEEDKERQHLGGLLVTEGLVTETQLARALAVQRRSGGLLGQILISMNCFNEDKLIEVLARQFSLPFVPVGSLQPDRSLRRILNATYALRHGVVPVALAGRRLTVAISDPTYRKPLDELASITGYDVDVVLTTPAHVDKLRSLVYGEDEEAEPETEEIPTGGVFKDIELAAPVGDGPGETDELLETLLTKVMEENASVIHLDPGEHGPRLLLRAEGQLDDLGSGELGSKIIVNYRSILRRLKTLAKMDLAERRKPQEGWFRVDKGSETSETAQFRLNIIPTPNGESVTLRVATGGHPPRTLDGLGFSEDVATRLREILRWPHGILLVVGPDSAGKSSTLWACADWLERNGRKVVALTTHTSFSLPNVVQFNLGEESEGLDALLGHIGKSDPDVVLLDEIRTGEAARWALEWARSGRVVVASLKALGTRSAMGFLRSLGMDLGFFAEHVSAILGQRLLRCICPDCAVPTESDAPDMQVLKGILPAQGDWKKGVGCESCRQTGFLGRIPAAELWVPRGQQTQPEDGSSSAGEVSGGAQTGHPATGDVLAAFEEQVCQVRGATEWVARGRTTVEELLRCFSPWELERRSGASRINPWPQGEKPGDNDREDRVA